MEQILIIDDDPRNTFALQAVLKARKYSCICAYSATEGISLLKSKNNIGIVLMDMMMPDLDGYQAISEIRLDDNIKAVPIIAVTAQAMVGDKDKCLQAGANGYISKPVNIDQLLVLLQQHIKE